jgi:hypothetical protein
MNTPESKPIQTTDASSNHTAAIGPSHAAGSSQAATAQVAAIHTTSLDGKSLAIGVLSVTAAVFLTAFLLLTTLAKPAHAIGMVDAGGDYKMLTQQISSSQEGIVVIDLVAQRMAIYGFDYSRRQLVPLSGFELKELKKSLRPATSTPGP